MSDMFMSNTDYNNLENVGVVLADDICGIKNKGIQFTTDLTNNNINLAMNYYGFLKENHVIAHSLEVIPKNDYIYYNHKAINQLQLLKLIEQLLGKVLLHKHAETTHVVPQSLFN